ncbi:PF08929 domain protein [Acinetobacter baumannii Naval-72]|uniref:PoNe immunity protein domain-containing protein n=1 Tax=Acinetobacter baumannii TaxID=470 RepID=UPI00028E461E|nr:PoNe immunity protein domain-containing protein [Acinetobacter baumannii]EKK07439.1 PF08929 domain protein [Acinetobacter baumannii Naval-72]
MSITVNDQDIDWQKWFDQEIKDSDSYRDSFLETEMYQRRFNTFLNGMYSVTDGFRKYKANAKAGKMMSAGHQRLKDVLNLMSLQYSAGGDISFIKELYPYLLHWMEEYAETSHLYNLSPDAGGRYVWHISLGTEDYWYIALRLICFGLLTGYADQMARIMPIIDYVEATPEGQEKDGLIERLVAPFVAGRGTPPDEARRHLPYRKLIKVFNAAPEQRPALILQYLESWYEASRREPYYNQHPRADIDEGFTYYGYWSWEAAAVTWLLEIDDALYRDHEFYPKDLVDFARTQSNVVPNEEQPERIKVKGGEACIKTGHWITPAKPDTRLYFTQGTTLPILSETDWGEVYWYWDGEN